MPSYPIPTTTISALTAATTPLAGTEVLPIVQSGTTKQVSVDDLTAGRAVAAASVTATGNMVARRLYIQGGNTSRIDIDSSGTGGVGGYDLLSIHSTNSVETLIGAFGVSSLGYCGTYSNHPFMILTGNVEKMRILASGNVGIGTQTPTALLQIKAGTATAGTAPLKLTSGTNLTTAEAGAIEYNGTTMFSTGTAASGRGINLAPQMVRLNADRPKANNTITLEAIFDPANDSLALAANTLYYFRGVYFFSKQAAANSAIQVGFTFSSTQQDIYFMTNATASIVTTSITNLAFVLNSANSPTGTTITGTNGAATLNYCVIEGWFKSNATSGGTLTPTFAQSVIGASAPTANAGSWFSIQPMSSDPNATLLAGNWS